jgi:fatty acid/phospholipid biosynthesis enzyme
MPITIAVDAMGADRAPKPEIEGAILPHGNVTFECFWWGSRRW